ncbi:cobalamin biosynthesis protein CbiB [mine drainage metagenome]|uniref:Cobalamin biosynthesis protein CbiB n=1 Tax=mine drainage metagenome TaxID=410659 RepID=A0A1J5S0G0_9ZZZZ
MPPWHPYPSAALLSAPLAILLDRLLGEPRRFHPLVGFGSWAAAIEAGLRRQAAQPLVQRLIGVLAWLLALSPWLLLALWLRAQLGWAVDVLLLYFSLGARSLAEHAEAVAVPLAEGRLAEARARVGRMVSRDTSDLDARGVARAGVESVLENGNDAVFGALFWFALAGGPGALLFRLANTLDAMWGYRTPRYRYFGWAAARLDDVLNYLPARLTALSYALLGRTRCALACWRSQAGAWDSPNAGPVMAAGAGSLGLVLGGSASYHGTSEIRPRLGFGAEPVAADIRRAAALVRHALWLWLALWLAWSLAGA